MDDRYTSFTNLISSLYRNIFLIKEEETLKYGLKSNHVSVLYALHKHGELTQVELIDICQENKAAISRTLKYLLDNDYIIIIDSESVYKKKYSLTQKGIEIAEIIQDRIINILDEASGDIPEATRNKMYKSLYVIDKNLRKLLAKRGKDKSVQD